ncbi:hypothetical protein LP420_18660 [Massilia sp. B-10]|nr:hypothetical protein LP420_18660 [Massilia sp. B-10]
MNIAKNMEVIFVAALAIISTTTFATMRWRAEQERRAGSRQGWRGTGHDHDHRQRQAPDRG